MTNLTYENYPRWIVAVCNAVSLGIYAIGLYLTARAGILCGVVYAAYCVWMECRLLTGSCRYCCYYGKRCAFGKGVICSWFLKKAERTSIKQISWLNLLPEFMVSLVPLAVGLVLLISGFSWFVMLLMLVLLGLASVGTGFVRGQLACKHCRRRELGCPAEQFFSKTKQA